MDLKLTERLERLNEKVKGSRAFKPLKRPKIASTVGAVTGGLQGRLRELLAMVLDGNDETARAILNRWSTIDVGDLTLGGPDGGYDVALSAPVASDLWYLTISPSILPFEGESYQENAEKIRGFLSEYTTYLDEISPLKSLRNYQDLYQYFSVYDMRLIWDNETAPFVIREMRYETWTLTHNTEFPSNGPKVPDGTERTEENSLGALYRGFLSFPVGPLGVMEVLSMFSETMPEMIEDRVNINETDNTTVSLSPKGIGIIQQPIDWQTGMKPWKCVRDRVLDGFMSPKTDMLSYCPGVHLVDKGYLATNVDGEYPATPMAGYDGILPLHSFRYYLRTDAKWPVPGEFIGLLAKPWPSHIWWYQVTSPVLYSGNWIETNHYTSGIVTAVMPPLPGAVGVAYKVVVRGVEMCIATSDFFTYALGDRVAIIRIKDLDRSLDEKKGNFKWKEMVDLIARDKEETEKEEREPSGLDYIINTDLMIVPISFYKQEEVPV